MENGAQHVSRFVLPGDGASGANFVVTTHALKKSETVKQHTTNNTQPTTTTTTTTKQQQHPNTAGQFDVPVGLSSQSVPYTCEELTGEARSQPRGLQGQRDESNDG